MKRIVEAVVIVALMALLFSFVPHATKIPTTVPSTPTTTKVTTPISGVKTTKVAPVTKKHRVTKKVTKPCVLPDTSVDA